MGNSRRGAKSTSSSRTPVVTTTEAAVLFASPLELHYHPVKGGNPYAKYDVAKNWKEIQGEKLWDKLLDPLDNVLRAEIIRYGEFIQATYDSFDSDTHDPFSGSNKWGKPRLFEKLGMQNRGYEVTDYIYATSGKGVPLAKYFLSLPDTNCIDPNTGKKVIDEAWDLESNWMGYVAITTDPMEIKRLGRRDIIVAWRGSVTKLEWWQDLQDHTVPDALDPRDKSRGVKVESGFLQFYKSSDAKSPYTKKSARLQMLEALERLIEKYGNEELSITVCGHSLGSAMAMLAAYDIAETGVNQASKLPEAIATWDEPDPRIDPNQVVEDTRNPDVKTISVTVMSYGGPRVGNNAFRDRMDELDVKVLRIVNVNDIVPHVPGLLVNDRLLFLRRKLPVLNVLWNFIDSLPWTYIHVGVPLYIDSLKSPYMRFSLNPLDCHDLEQYMHSVSGFVGPKVPFTPSIFRDLALVNKNSDLLNLKEKYVPPEWQQEANKGLVLTDEGVWRPKRREKVDYPQYLRDETAHANETAVDHVIAPIP